MEPSDVRAVEPASGKVLHTLVGYIARPAGVQVAAYILTVAGIASLAALQRPRFDRAATV